MAESQQKYKKNFSSSITQDEENKKNNVQAIVIPEHLRATAPDPLQHLCKKSSTTSNGGGGTTTKSSVELSKEAKKLKAEMEALKQQRADRLKALKEKQRKRMK